ncbi:UNVERIFIED_CONTAM: hypothetical protein HDU68_009502 [Siphonaria sp. JEL0065]|nr:hypothetical protein HDU68_009502 [Siphonaria sp. JEL0065]
MGFTGELPSLEGWTSLRQLNLRKNEFSAEVPAIYFNKNFDRLDISHNCLTGTSGFPSQGVIFDFNVETNNINPACFSILARRDGATDAATDLNGNFNTGSVLETEFATGWITTEPTLDKSTASNSEQNDYPTATATQEETNNDNTPQWGTFTGSYVKVVVVQRWDAHMQLFALTSAGTIDVLNEWVANDNTSWSEPGSYSLTAVTDKVWRDFTVAQDVNGRLEVFARDQDPTANFNMFGGDYYVYTMSSLTGYTFDDTPAHIEGWAYGLVTAQDFEGKLNYFEVGGVDFPLVKFGNQAQINTASWTAATTLQGGGGESIKQITAIKNGDGMIEVWGAGLGGLRRVFETNFGWSERITWNSNNLNPTSVKSVKLYDGTVMPFVLNDMAELFYGPDLTQLATGIWEFHVVADVDNNAYVFMLDTAGFVSYRTYNGAWSETVAIPSNFPLSSFSVVFGSGGLWQLYGVFYTSPIYYITASHVGPFADSTDNNNDVTESDSAPYTDFIQETTDQGNHNTDDNIFTDYVPTASTEVSFTSQETQSEVTQSEEMSDTLYPTATDSAPSPEETNTGSDWDILGGNYMKVVAIQRWDSGIQVFGLKPEGVVATLFQWNPNDNTSWSDWYSLTALENKPFKDFTVAQDINGKIEVFARDQSFITNFGHEGGNYYVYRTSGENVNAFVDTPHHIDGWAFGLVTAMGMEGRIYFFDIGGTNGLAVKHGNQIQENTASWTEASTLQDGGGGTLTHITAAKNGNGYIEVWGAGEGGLWRTFQTSAGWAEWTAWNSLKLSPISVQSVKLFDGSIVPFVLTEEGELLYSPALVPIASSIGQFQVIADVDNVAYVFMLSINGDLAYRTFNGAWSETVAIPGQTLSSFSVVFRVDGLWQLFGVSYVSPIHYILAKDVGPFADYIYPSLTDDYTETDYVKETETQTTSSSDSPTATPSATEIEPATDLSYLETPSMTETEGKTETSSTETTAKTETKEQIATTTESEEALNNNGNNAINTQATTFRTTAAVTTVQSTAPTTSPAPILNPQCILVTSSFSDVTDPTLQIDCGNVVNNTRYTWGWQPPTASTKDSTGGSKSDFLLNRRRARRYLQKRDSNNFVIISLSLSGLKITGAIPVSLGALSSLQALDMSGNSFSGEIPDIFGAMTALATINLSGNQLSGEIPASLVALPSLGQIMVAGNTLAAIPVTLLKTLFKNGGAAAVALAQSNTLNADCTLLKLTFSGYNTSTIGQTVLSVLNQDCSAPSNTTRVSYLLGPALKLTSNFTFSENSTTIIGTAAATTSTGTAPSFFKKRRSLSRRAINIDSNRYRVYSVSVSGLGISGSVPSGLGFLPFLQSLDISNNAFTGSIPSSFSNLASLKRFNFGGNSISGRLPPGLAEIIASNGGNIDFGTSCVFENPHAVCGQPSFPVPKIDCFQLSREKTYVDSVYDPLWKAGKLSDYAGFKESWDASKSSGNSLVTEWQYNAFKSYYKKVKWCKKNFPIYQYWTFHRVHGTVR